jgi:hypothetical protein
MKKDEQNPTWSIEDEEMVNKIIDYMKPMPIFFESTKGKSGKEYTKEFVKETIKWLKSLKERCTWKPSDEQMNALDSTLQYGQVSYNSVEHLNSLFNDLNKLMRNNMKANETPEKIYVHKSQYWGLRANEHDITKNGIKYVLTDAFIDKACKYLFENYHGERLSLRMIEDFKNYMKGE